MADFFEKFTRHYKFPTESLLLVIGFSLLLGGCLVLLNENDLSNRVGELEQNIEVVSKGGSIKESGTSITADSLPVDSSGMAGQVIPGLDDILKIESPEDAVADQSSTINLPDTTATTTATGTLENSLLGELGLGGLDFEVTTGIENSLEIITPKHDTTVTTEPVVFKGKVSPTTKKVVVNALVIGRSGIASSSVYTISDFKLGNIEFTYTSKPEWGNLVQGTNTYHFTAFYVDGTSKSTSVTVYYQPAS